MGFIKKLLGGLFSLLGGILKVFGLGKKSEYFLEADSAADSSAPAQPAVAAAQVEAPAPAIAPKAAENGKATQPAAAPVMAVAAAPAAPAPAAKAEPVGNFSTDYLLTSGGSRRRPGPSLNPFMDMAKQVKPQGQ